MAGTALTVEVVSDLPHLEALEGEWNSLAWGIPWPMAQFGWIISAARAYQDDRLCIIVLRKSGTIQAVAPFVLRRYGLAHRLECLDHKLSEPQRLIARNEHYLQLLLKVLRMARYPLLLRGSATTSEDVHEFKRLTRAGLWVEKTSGSQDSFVPFSDIGQDLEERMSTKRRCTLRRKRRAAEKHGTVRFTITRPRPDELPELLDEFCRVESSGWKGRAATGLQYDSKRSSFFRMYSTRMAHEGALRLGFMTIGNATAAVRLDVIWANKSWELEIGYDEHFAHCSPGLLLSHEALRHGQAEGLLGHHFLGEAEPWHDTWAANKVNRVTLRYYPTTMSGMSALFQDALSRVGRTIRRRRRLLSADGKGAPGKSDAHLKENRTNPMTAT
ncbi:GNAT family N-acetyltransferase [Microvirga calopogonii]|uniref:GNAT family N-acetyltransferase n=1 Tax=Microvirga calopogonii TaxID=2078013 RepID=UPI0013B42230|nr:GNAT family N-acetyltransferase [Microvirga calopogonii]